VFRTAVQIIVASLTLAPVMHAGECVQGSDHYVSELERIVREGLPYSYDEAFNCLQGECSPADYVRWAGPIAASRFETCRSHPLRDRIAAACLPLLADSTVGEDGFSARLAAAGVAAAYGFSRVGPHDIFAIGIGQILAAKHPPDPRFGSLAAMGDSRTLDFLKSFYASAADRPAEGRNYEISDVLNCLYHVHGDSAAAFAAEIERTVTDPELKERARRVRDR